MANVQYPVQQFDSPLASTGNPRDQKPVVFVDDQSFVIEDQPLFGEDQTFNIDDQTFVIEDQPLFGQGQTLDMGQPSDTFYGKISPQTLEVFNDL